MTTVARLLLAAAVLPLIFAEIGHYYSFNPPLKNFRQNRVSLAAPFDMNAFPPPKAAYFVGTAASFSKKLNQKPDHFKSPVRLSPSPPNHEPMLNSDPSEAPQKQSVAVNSFSEAQREPTAVNFGFLPVFPWPEKVPKKVHHLFPKSGQNEMGWRVPQVDNQLSQFPHPGTTTSAPVLTTATLPQRWNQRPHFTLAPQRLSPTRYDYAKVLTSTPAAIVTATLTPPPSTTAATNEHVWNPSMLTNQPTFPTLRTPAPTQGFQLDSAVSTTPIPRRISTRKPDPQPPSHIPPEWPQRSARTVSSWSQGPRKRNEKLNEVKGQKFRDPVPRSNKLEKASNGKYKASNCRALSPVLDAVPHPHTADSDTTCEQGFPGWQRDANCRCTFLVASRNFLGCATKFHTLCWRV